MIPDIKITRRTLFKGAPSHFRASAVYRDGREYFGTGNTPAEAVTAMAAQWTAAERNGQGVTLLRQIMRGKRE